MEAKRDTVNQAVPSSPIHNRDFGELVQKADN